jgi:hypothetical protein
LVDSAITFADGIKWTQKSLADTFFLIIDANNNIDTASMVAVASYQIRKINPPYVIDFIKTWRKKELALGVFEWNQKKGKYVESKKYRVMKPYSASDMQILNEVEKLNKRVFVNRLCILILTGIIITM